LVVTDQTIQSPILIWAHRDGAAKVNKVKKIDGTQVFFSDKLIAGGWQTEVYGTLDRISGDLIVFESTKKATTKRIIRSTVGRYRCKAV